jgi:D-lyxose ketol-isomerase
MKRSELNRILLEAMEFMKRQQFQLPPFAFWTGDEWKTKGHEYDEIRNNLLGWDITDFGSNDFHRIGLLLFTLRNGNAADLRYSKPYAEKIMVVQEEQITPFHFHWSKMEDIINRGGGNLLIRLFNSTENGLFADSDVPVSMDGRNYTVKAGSTLRLSPGESITLPTGQYHSFWGEKGMGKILVGEVSQVNDDRIDNRFYEQIGRFPTIEEDEAPLYLLGHEYPLAPMADSMLT